MKDLSTTIHLSKPTPVRRNRDKTKRKENYLYLTQYSLMIAIQVSEETR